MCLFQKESGNYEKALLDLAKQYKTFTIIMNNSSRTIGQHFLNF